MKYLCLAATFFLSLSCITRQNHNTIKGLSSQTSTSDYLTMNGHSEAEVAQAEQLSLKIFQNMDTGSLNLTDDGNSENNFVRDLLICAKGQFALLVKGGGAICKSRKTGKLKSVYLFGAGLDQGFEAGIVFIGYNDFSKKQIYRGFELGMTVYVGLTAAYAGHSKYGKLWLFSFNAGLMSNIGYLKITVEDAEV